MNMMAGRFWIGSQQMWILVLLWPNVLDEFGAVI